MSLGRLQFDQQSIFDQKVGAKAFLKNDAIESNRYRFLAFDAQAALCEALRKTGFVNRFEKAGPEGLMQLEATIN